MTDFTCFERLVIQIHSQGFAALWKTKKGRYQRSREVREAISPYCGEFPTEPNSTKISAWAGVADVINHTKFGDYQSREYEIKEGQMPHGNDLSRITVMLL